RPRRGRTRLARLTFGVALEPVGGQGLPLAGVVDERVPLRPDVVAGVEETEAHASDLAGVRVQAPERAATARAEALRPPVLGRVLAHELLAGQQAEGSRREAGLGRRSRAGPALAPRAVAVPGAERLRRHLEPDAAAHAMTAVGRPSHGRDDSGGPPRDGP